jgi:hypothetical protein
MQSQRRQAGHAGPRRTRHDTTSYLSQHDKAAQQNAEQIQSCSCRNGTALCSVEDAAARRGLRQGREQERDDGDDDQRREDVLVDGQQAHLPHA